MNTPQTVGILHPGAMGAFIAGGVHSQHRVQWASQGRSAESHIRAAGFMDVGTVEALASTADAIICVCPPEFAFPVASTVAGTGFTGCYIDANAVSPMTMSAIRDVVHRATVIDGAIIGGPRSQSAVLHLAGDSADAVASLFDSDQLRVNVLTAPFGAASALKACFALSTKAYHALLLQSLAAASASGVDEVLRQEWERMFPGLTIQVDQLLATINRKAWRYVGELVDAQAYFGSLDMPTGFSDAAVEIFGRLSQLSRKNDNGEQEVIAALSAPRPEAVVDSEEANASG